MLWKTHKVNVDAILKLAEYVEKSDTYDQKTYGLFGTPRCICGHQNVLRNRADLEDTDAAQRDLGLSLEECNKLFAAGIEIGGKPPTNADAAHCLRQVAATGKVPHWWK